MDLRCTGSAQAPAPARQQEHIWPCRQAKAALVPARALHKMNSHALKWQQSSATCAPHLLVPCSMLLVEAGWLSALPGCCEA